MIQLLFNEVNFEYDVQGLVRSFYPGIDTVTNTPCEALFTIQIIYTEESFSIEIIENDVVQQKMEISTKGCDRTEMKNRLKRSLYQLLSERTNQTLPWGTLTGIRPTKIPMGLIEQGMQKEEIKEYLKNEYYLSDQKIDQAFEIAKTEYSLLRRIDYKDGYSLYIGIPFCPSTCLYCSFTSYPIASYRKKVESYLDALEKELVYLSKEFKNNYLQTIYIGGGTPTTLEPSQLRRLIRMVKSLFDLSHVTEFTVEAGRPDSITEDKLKVLKEEGISRISINPQTMQDKTLKLIGRHHCVADIKEKYQLARSIGFDNINMDIIVGLPGETIEDVRDTLAQIEALHPDSLTVHSLAIKRAARLNIMKDIYKDYHFENSTEIMDMVEKSANRMGLKPYYLYRQKNMAGNLENVGYATPGKECLYNILIMEEKQTIAAAGAGASTKYVYANGTKIERAENVKNVDQYIDRIGEMIYRKKCLFWKQISDKETMLYEQIAHGATVSNLAVEIARELGKDEEFVYQMAIAGIYHDIGKGDLMSIIMKDHLESSLDIEKTRKIREHVKHGYDILKSRGFSDFICEAILYHHENFDGSGYPFNLSGNEIPLSARILRVCDVFAALNTTRWYRDAYSPEDAIRLMIEENSFYDVEVFLALMRVFHEKDYKKLIVHPEDVICFVPEEL